MTRAKKIIATVAGAAVVAVSALALTRRPVLWSFTDPGELQRPSLSVFNPLRDKAPERAAEEILLQLARGDIAGALGAVRVGGGTDANLQEKERQYQLHAWKLVNREDTATGVTLFYRIARGTSAQFDSPLIIRVESRDGQWRVIGFNPIY